MSDERFSGFFKLVNIKHVNIYILTYQHGFRRKQRMFHYPSEMTNENKKKIHIYIVATGNEENQQNVNVFTMVNVQTWKTQLKENGERVERLDEVFSKRKQRN